MKPNLEPAVLTIFGITGDLAHHKLLPALYELAHDGLLPEETKIVGITRSGIEVDEVIERVRREIDNPDSDTLAWLRGAISITTMDLDDQADYQQLKSQLDAIEEEAGVCMNRLHYLSIPSSMFGTVSQRLGEADLNSGCQHDEMESRLLIEKPFGRDLSSAEQLAHDLRQTFDERQLYRIDHYLAKETVQNILTFRFENPLFANSWDNNHVSHILITAAESIGIEGRDTFYEQTGALRDVVQSHLLQLLALVTMDEPADFSAAAIHKQKTALLRSLSFGGQSVSSVTVRAQYDGYLDEVDDQTSRTETYAALRIEIDSERWRGVPLLLRTGKKLAEKVTEITVVFRSGDGKERNTLTLRIQPNEGIVLNLQIKEVGYEHKMQPVKMDYCYPQADADKHPDAYERVLVDALRGDKTLFTNSDEVIASWQLIQPVLDTWQAEDAELSAYETGSWGPDQASKLAADSGCHWLTADLGVCTVHRH